MDVKDIALAHHWLLNKRGGEKVFLAMCSLFKGADIYTLFYNSGVVNYEKQGHVVYSSILNMLPFSNKFYRNFIPLYPLALNLLKVSSKKRLLISSDASILKGINISATTFHVCYCHSPARYLWEMFEDYLKLHSEIKWYKKLFFKFFKKWLQKKDYSYAQRVDLFISNSEFVRQRIKKYYNKDSILIYPPVDIKSFKNLKSEGFFLCVSELVGYKRIDLVVDAFSRISDPLIVVGAGPEFNKLLKRGASNIEFLGSVSADTLIDLYSRCRCFVQAQVEDFGITAVEAQASGKPVVAFKNGGASEIVQDGKTGVLFDEQTVESLLIGIEKFKSIEHLIEVKNCIENSEKFSVENFNKKFISVIRRHCSSLS